MFYFGHVSPFAPFPLQKLHHYYKLIRPCASCTDDSRDMFLRPSVPQGTPVTFFPGSSIGNFDPDHAVDFLTSITERVGSGGYLLIGVDLKKDTAILEAASDDPSGITAQFNLNFLTRINCERL